MKLIKGSKALAKELHVHPITICIWLKNGKIKPHRRIMNTIFYDLDDLFPNNQKRKRI